VLLNDDSESNPVDGGEYYDDDYVVEGTAYYYDDDAAADDDQVKDYSEDYKDYVPSEYDEEY
jgi:hypothetical protein